MRYVAVLVVVWMQVGEGAAPPPLPVQLSREQQVRLNSLEERATKAIEAGQYGEALKRKREALALRKQWQGTRHWETINATFEVTRLEALASLPGSKQKEMGESEQETSRGMRALAQARYDVAEHAFRKALAISKKVLGEQHPDTATSYNNLALCLQNLGKAAEALPLYEKALAIDKKVLGEQHPDTATSYNNVASCLDAQGKAAEALPLYEKALTIYKKVLGEQHPYTAASYNSVALCLQNLGKAAEALPLFERALAIRKKVMGEQHSHTATSYDGLASCLQDLGKAGEALPLYEKALVITKKVVGEQHPDTALSYNNLALCLNAQGKAGEALPLFEKALAIDKKVLGEQHPNTALSYNNLALCLNAQGKVGEALPLFERALAIRKKVLGEQHPATATSYNNLAYCLQGQGKAVEALPLYEKALAIYKKVLGEQHPATASSYNGLASCLDAQGKAVEALPLYEKALAIRKKVLGEQHPDTALSYNNLAYCLQKQGKAAEALSLYEKALAIRMKVLGEEHPSTATSYNNVASCLDAQGKMGEALPLYEKALAIFKKVLGEQHPDTALSYNNLASCLQHLGKAGEALTLYEKALAIFKKVLGEQHPHTASSYNNLAYCLQVQGRAGEAIRVLQQGLPSHDASRLLVAATGFDRARFRSTLASPREVLALLHAMLSKPGEAWGYLEASLGRGLLDDQSGVVYAEDAELRTGLAKLDELLLPLFGRTELSQDQKTLRDELSRQRRGLLAEAARRVARRSASLVLPLEEIQKHIPDDAVLAVWLSVENQDPWVCLVRREGEPQWVRLEGSGAKGAWTEEDQRLPAQLYQAVASLEVPRVRRQRLLAETKKRWFDPLSKHLRATKTLPAVRHLMVVPVGPMARLPVEVLAEGYQVSYTPSMTYFARARQKHRPLVGSTLLALGDPIFQMPARPGEKRIVRSEAYVPLPGTRYEVEALRQLVGETRTKLLLGSEASDVNLEQLAQADRLREYRLIHLATHGTINLERPELTALVLARDRLPGERETLERAAKGLSLHDGLLRVRTIARDWKLDADLVTLSACETALGPSGRGDGLLGFAHVLMQGGARTVVLSRWKVDDTATALLMLRFYENLLGARKETKALGRAEALQEAKRWLSELPREEAERLATLLPAGKLTTTARGSIVVLKPKEKPSLPRGEKPYAHPAFWAAFTLIGDAE